MLTKTFCLTLLFLPKLSSFSVIRVEHDDVIACVNDSDCAKEHYCSTKTDYCEKCIPCSERFNRHPPASNNFSACAQTEEECGDCFAGYIADALANGKNFSTKCYPSEKLSLSSNPTASEKPSASIIFIASASIAFMVAMAFFAFFSKNIWLRISQLNAANAANVHEMGDVPPEPSAPPCVDSDLEESSEELGKLINRVPVSNTQQDQLCGAIPIGPYHTAEVDPLVISENNSTNLGRLSNIDANESAVSSINGQLEMTRQVSAVERVRPPVFRSISDSGLENPHVRLSHQRPTINQSANSSVEEESQLQLNENCLELEVAIVVKRSKKCSDETK